MKQTERMKVFVSYSRDDVAFADQLVVALDDRGFETILDRHSIDGAENWRERLSGLILSCDAVVFVLTDSSATSAICAWEVDEARRLAKRIVPVVPRAVTAASPQALADLNWIHFFATPTLPGAGMFDGLVKLIRALNVDLAWLREQTRLSERAAEWVATRADDRLLRGAALREAQEWLGRTPKDASVPVSVRDYLSASADVEQGREAAAKAQLEERERALKTAEGAVNEKMKVQKRLRVFGIVALAAGVVLSAMAIAGGWFAAQYYVASSEARSELFAREANARWKDRDYPKAMLIALYGDPAAQVGPVERALRPEGYVKARSALARAIASNPLRFAIRGTAPYVSAIAVDDKGKRILFGLSTGEVSVWPIGSDKPTAKVMADGKASYALALHPDGKRFLTGHEDGTVKLWRIGDSEPLSIFKGHKEAVNALAFHPDGLRFLSGSYDGAVMMWQIGQQGPMASFAHAGPVSSIAFHPDGQRFLVGFDGSGSSAVGAAVLWRIGETAPLASFSGDEYGVYSLAFHPDGRRVLVGSGRSARLWDIDQQKSLARFDAVGIHSSPVRSVVFHPDGKRVRTTDESGTTIDWRISDTARLATFRPPDGSVDDLVLLLPDGDQLLTGSGCCTAGDPFSVSLWRLAEENQVATFVDRAQVWSVAFHPDGERFLTGSWGDGAAKLWRIGEEKPLATFTGHKGWVQTVALDPKGERFLTASYDGTVKLWRIGQKEALETFAGHTGYVYSVAFHPDGQRFLTGSADGTAKLWRIGQKEALETFTGHTAGIWSVAFHPDGERFLTASDDYTAKLWRIGEKAPLATISGHEESLTSVAFHPDGERFLTGSWDHTAKLWRIGEDKPLATFAEEGAIVWSVAFHPDGEHFLTGSANQVVKLWRIGEENPLATFAGHQNDIPALAFHPDGKRFLSGSRDGTAILWSLPAIEFASPTEQVRMACDTLKAVGVMELSEEDYARVPFLDRNAPHPCAKVWGFDPRRMSSIVPKATANAQTPGSER